MPTPSEQNSKQRSIDWRGIARTLLVQVLVLFALSVAFVRYLDWSSEAAWAEFSAATKSLAMDHKSHTPAATPVQVVKGPKLCTPKT